MVPPPGRRSWLAAGALVGALAAGCGNAASGSNSTGASTTAPAPAASIDPNARGVITGPINSARNTANQLNEQQNRTQQQAGGG